MEQIDQLGEWVVGIQEARRCLLLVPELMMIMHHGNYEIESDTFNLENQDQRG